MKILFLYLTDDARVSALARFSRDRVEVRPLQSIMGHRADIVVVEPLDGIASDTARAQYDEMVSHARCKALTPGTPLIVGNLV